jgi:hypothetical protein
VHLVGLASEYIYITKMYGTMNITSSEISNQQPNQKNHGTNEIKTERFWKLTSAVSYAQFLRCSSVTRIIIGYCLYYSTTALYTVLLRATYTDSRSGRIKTVLNLMTSPAFLSLPR